LERFTIGKIYECTLPVVLNSKTITKGMREKRMKVFLREITR